MTPPRLYGDLAGWWPLLSPPEDYADEAAIYREQLLAGRAPDRAMTALELGCGGGHCAFHMQDAFSWTLTDLSSAMVAQSRRLNPRAEHIVADMRTMRLERAFDAVFAHDAICYMTTRDDLRAAIVTAFAHCRPGGAALFVPDCVRETFTSGTDQGGRDGDGRALRYFEWLHELRADATSVQSDMVLMLREHDETRVVHDRHEFGVFARAVWHEELHAAGFEFVERSLQPEGRPLFACRRPR